MLKFATLLKNCSSKIATPALCVEASQIWVPQQIGCVAGGPTNSFGFMPDELGYDLIDELPADGAREKEVFARFGLAVYKAQVFDHALVNLIAVASRVRVVVTSDEVDRQFDALFRKTSGALVTDIREAAYLGEDDLALCHEAVGERNRLIHRFFRDHAENFMTSRGQQVMVDDLASVVELIERADAACNRVMLKVGERYGMTETAIKQAYQHLLESARSEGGASSPN